MRIYFTEQEDKADERWLVGQNPAAKAVRVQAGPYYPLGAIRTVPRTHDTFRTYEGMERK
jgi:hypothetical protein